VNISNRQQVGKVSDVGVGRVDGDVFLGKAEGRME